MRACKRTLFGRLCLLALLILAATGCAKESLSRALFSMGEQAQCAQVGDHRIDGPRQQAICLANAFEGNEFDEYSKAREQHLSR